MNHSASLLGACALIFGLAVQGAAADENVTQVTASDMAYPISECGLMGEAPSYVANHLITVFDRSPSVTHEELMEMLRDVADALEHRSFISGVEQTGPVAVSTATFSSDFNAYRVLPTYIIHDEASAIQVASLLRASIDYLTANEEGSGTDMSLALQAGFGMAEVCEGEFNPTSDVFAHNVRINIVSDFEASDQPAALRNLILAHERYEGYPYITINALGLVPEPPEDYTAGERTMTASSMTNYARNNVTGGPQSFELMVQPEESFGEKFRQKILLDIGLFRDEFLPQPASMPG